MAPYDELIAAALGAIAAVVGASCFALILLHV